MTDRPIIFSAPMVRALLEGRKTQTRRLASSPLRRCEPGDRLYVREAVSCGGVFTDVVEVRYKAHERASHTEFVEQIPVRRATSVLPSWPTFRPSIHMPRWASRLTLIVEAVALGSLQAITEADAQAEGCVKLKASGRAVERQGDQHFGSVWPTCRAWYADLWDSLHTKPGERWDDDPDVLALTFRVITSNIDQVSP